MKLPFDAYSDKVPALVKLGAASTSQSKIKLIYRGHTYDYTPRPVAVPIAVKTDSPRVTLIYRGNTYERHIQAPKPHQTPRAINWRYQVSSQLTASVPKTGLT